MHVSRYRDFFTHVITDRDVYSSPTTFFMRRAKVSQGEESKGEKQGQIETRGLCVTPGALDSTIFLVPGKSVFKVIQAVDVNFIDKNFIN